QAVEHFSIPSDPLLSIENRPPVADEDAEGDEHNGREKKHEHEGAERHIEHPLYKDVRAEMPDFPQLQSLLYGIIVCVQHEPAPGCFVCLAVDHYKAPQSP